MFHSMLVAYAVLVPTLYRNRGGQDCMGVSNIAWLAESFTFLDSIRLNV